MVFIIILSDSVFFKVDRCPKTFFLDSTFDFTDYLYLKCNLMKGLGLAGPCASRNIMNKHNVKFLAPDCHSYGKNRVLSST